MKNIYISSSFRDFDDLLQLNLKQDLIELGYQVLNRFNDEYYSEDHISTPEYLISRADLFIAIIRENNPFVLYELGYATALGKKVLIISESELDLPSSLRKYDIIRFEFNISNTILNVISFLQNNVIEEKQIMNNISNFKDFIKYYKENSQIIDRISSKEFEDYIYDYFVNLKVNIEKPILSTDYGYDFILKNWNGFNKTIVEVKKYNRNSKVSVNTIQQIIGAMNVYEADHALVITTSEFTASAKEFAKSIIKKIDLWDINYLTRIV